MYTVPIGKQNLAAYNVLLDDYTLTQKFFGLDINSYFSVGKWSFFLNPPANNLFYWLQPETVILSELIDSYGKPIFINYPTSGERPVIGMGPDGSPIYDYNAVTNFSTNRSYGYFLPKSSPRKLLASVDVLDTIADGPAVLTLLAVATKEGLAQVIKANDPKLNLIDKWVGYYNIKYQTIIDIDKKRKNIAPLVFKNSPDGEISEINQYYYEDSVEAPFVTISGSARLETLSINFSLPVVGSSTGDDGSSKTPEELNVTVTGGGGGSS